MDAIKEQARALGLALQRSPTYVRFVAAQEAHEADAPLQEYLRSLEMLRMQYQHEAQKDPPSEPKMHEYQAKFEALCAEVEQNPHTQEVQAAAAAIDAQLQWVQGYLNGVAGGAPPETFEPPAKCGGASGCHGCKGGCGG